MPEKPSKIRIALISGAVIGVVSALPGLNLINCCCCAGILLGGMLSVYLYKQEFTEGMPPMESSDAVILGIVSGVVGAFSMTILDVLIASLFGDLSAELARSVMERLLEIMEEQGTVPAELIEQLRSEMEKSFAESQSFWAIISNLFVSLIVYPIFAMLGGLLGYSIWRPKRQSPTIQPQ